MARIAVERFAEDMEYKTKNRGKDD